MAGAEGNVNIIIAIFTGIMGGALAGYFGFFLWNSWQAWLIFLPFWIVGTIGYSGYSWRKK
jgi:hypothetical protein